MTKKIQTVFAIFVLMIVVSILIGTRIDCWSFVEKFPEKPKNQKIEKEKEVNKKEPKEEQKEEIKEELKKETILGTYYAKSGEGKGHYFTLRSDGTIIDDAGKTMKYKYDEKKRILTAISIITQKYKVSSDLKTITSSEDSSDIWQKRD